MESKKTQIKERHKIYILLLFAIYSEIGYSLLAPLYPIEAEMRKVTSSMIGIIFASFGASNFIFSIITPNLIKKYGRENLLIFSLILEGVCTFFFFLINLIINKNIFIYISLILRFAQGIAAAIIQTLLYSIAASISSKKNIEKNIGYIELADALGIAIGPLVASISYYYFKGFIAPFLICGIMETSGIFLVDCIGINENVEKNKTISNDDNIDEEKMKLSKNDEIKNDNNNIDIKNNNDNNNDNKNILQTFKDKYIFLVFLSVIFDELSISFIYPVFSVYLKKQYNVNPETSSLYFIIETISYFFSVEVIGILNKKLGNINTIIVGAFLNSFFILFLGPISILPKKIFLVFFGLFGIGMSGAFINIPAVIEMIRILNEKFLWEKSDSENYSSALFNIGFNIGEAVGTLIGGIITDKFNFSWSCIFVSFLNFILGLFFIGVIFWDNVFKKEYKKISKGNVVNKIVVI